MKVTKKATLFEINKMWIDSYVDIICNEKGFTYDEILKTTVNWAMSNELSNSDILHKEFEVFIKETFDNDIEDSDIIRDVVNLIYKKTRLFFNLYCLNNSDTKDDIINRIKTNDRDLINNYNKSLKNWFNENYRHKVEQYLNTLTK